MGTLRRLQRNIVKNNIANSNRSVKRCFEDEWKTFRENKYVVKDEEGNVISDKTPRNTMPKKQRHFDNVEQYTRMFAFMEGLRNAKNVNVDEVVADEVVAE